MKKKNKIYRWKIVADLDKFGLKNATIKEKHIPFIKNPYKDVEWNSLSFEDRRNNFQCFKSLHSPYWINPPRITIIDVDNYQGIIEMTCNDANKIEWYLDGVKIKTKYNVVGEFRTIFKVENLEGKKLSFVLKGDGGETHSKTFELFKSEVL